MTGARFVHDTLEAAGWDVEIADAQKVKGLAPLACKTDRIDSMVLATLSQRDLVPSIWLPDPRIRQERELARFRLHLVKHRSMLKNRIHSSLISFGKPCPVTDLFGAEGRKLLAEMEIPEPWRSDIAASTELIDHLERQIDQTNKRLRAGHAYSPLHPAADERAGDRLGPRLHDRRRDRRDREVLLTREADRLHRPLPAGQPIRRQGPPRADHQAGPDLPALGPDRGDDARLSPPRLSPSATSETRSGWASNAGPRSPRSTSPAGSRHAIWHMLSRNEEFAPRGAIFV